MRTSLRKLNLGGAALVLSAGLCLASDPTAISGRLSGKILATGDQRVMVLSTTGQVEWEYPTKLAHDVWMLPNGHVLFADGETVTEVTREKQVVFQYRAAEQKGGATYSCQRLADGKTLAGENSTGRVLELDATGQIAFTLQTSPSKVGEHHNLRMTRKLDNGHYLVCHSGAGVVKEYTAQGEVVWQVKPAGALAFAALRTPQGDTLISSLDQIEEFDAQGKKTWSCSVQEIPGTKPRNLTGLQWLANGHVVAGCYQGYKDGEGFGLLEISREKQLVWGYSQPKGDHSMMGVELLTPTGGALPGPCLR
jgi:outer membrane protein assembly factor BamB